MSSPNVDNQNVQGAGGQQQQAADPSADLEQNIAQVLEMIADNFGEEVEGKEKKGEKKDVARSSGVFAGADVFGLLGKVVGMPGSTAAAMKEVLRNPGPPGGPRIPAPIRDLRDVPGDASGSGNPWLAGSVFTELIMIMFEIMPILFQIKLDEAELEAQHILLLQEATIKGAEMAKKKKELEAKELKLDAIKQFVQAGISIGMAAMQMGMTHGGMAKSAASKVKSGLKTGAGMAYRGAKMAGSHGWQRYQKGYKNWKPPGSEFLRNRVNQAREFKNSLVNSGPVTRLKDFKQNMADRKQNLAAKLKGENMANYEKGTEHAKNLAEKRHIIAANRRERIREEKETAKEGESAKTERTSTDTKKQQEAQRMQARNMTLQQIGQALQGVAGGLIDLEKAEIRAEIGSVEYVQQVMQGLQQAHQKMIDSAHEARREAADGLSTMLQQLNNIIQAQQAFNMKR